MIVTIESQEAPAPTFGNIEYGEHFVHNGALYRKVNDTTAILIFKTRLNDSRKEGEAFNYSGTILGRIYRVVEINIKVEE